MERLTYWCDDGQGGGGWRVNADGLEQSGPHVWRLAAIENILCGEDDKEYDLERLEVILNQRMTMREVASQRFSVTAKIPVDRLREIVAAERERRAVLERLGEFGQLFIDYVGCPRGGPGRECAPLTEELLSMPVITDVDGGRWRPVNEDTLREAVEQLRKMEEKNGMEEIKGIVGQTHTQGATGDFGWALRELKAGKKLQRAGWNGKGQYIELAERISYVNPEMVIINPEHEAIGNKAIAFVGTSGVQLGWLASQSDMLASDWRIAANSDE